MAIARDVLVAHVNLMTTPTKEQLAEKLAETIHDDLASTLFRRAGAPARVRAGSGSRPSSPSTRTTGKLGFTFDAGRQPQDVDATLERLLELPGQLAAERERKVALVLDEFQEIVDIDRDLPKLMRSVFETQPEVAHVYLGSKRHMLERIFNDENEPFWRSAKQMRARRDPAAALRGYIDGRFASTGRRIDRRGRRSRARRHPRPSLCDPGALLLPVGGDAGGRGGGRRASTTSLSRSSCAPSTPTSASSGRRPRARSGSCCRRSRASRAGRSRASTAAATGSRARRASSGPSRRSSKEELVARDGRGEYRIAEPFLAEWLGGRSSRPT